MDNHWAADHLQVIRTLMERSAIYRRALAPVMLMVGLLGFLAALLGWFFQLNLPLQFALFWMSISVVALCGAFFLVRRQAIQERDLFWSPPTRRVAQALAPPLVAGALLGVLVVLAREQQSFLACLLPALWMLLYGCAVHAAGFFMPRGIKLFGWLFILAAAGLLIGLPLSVSVYPIAYAHLLMGLFFGGFHLAYAIYLFFSEKRNA
jgi:hypothetical protein